jgi:minor extracellular protease Epr
MSSSIKCKNFKTFMGIVLLWQGPSLSWAQVIRDIGPAVQVVTERQVERAMQRAEAMQNRAVEQAAERQAESVQNQTLERVANQVERAQSQASERTQNQALERAQLQATDRAQVQASERAQLRLEGQGQVDRLPSQTGVPERVSGTANLPLETQPDAVPVLGQTDTPAAVAAPVEETLAPGAFVELVLPDGARAVAFEWIMLVNAEERLQLAAESPQLLGFLRRSVDFALNDGELLTFLVPPDLDANDAILQLVPENLRDQIDRNHVFSPRTDKDGQRGLAGSLQLPMNPVCDMPLAIGMIDSDIDVGHLAFRHLQGRQEQLIRRNFVDANLKPAMEHGTAVAALFAGQHEAEGKLLLAPLVPQARIFSAAVFHEADAGDEGAPAQRILEGLDWLSRQEGLAVINMSLAGPPNRLLERTLVELARQGKLVVAAVGNDGPHGPLRYPAAYPEVLGVAAVESDGRSYRWSNQGAHVDFSALGAGVLTASGEGFELQSGTSLATPVITAFMACNMARLGDVDKVLSHLDTLVLDLGEPGRDPIYGRGLLHPW